MPVPPAQLRRQLEASGLSVYEATLLTESREKAQFFEAATAASAGAAFNLIAAHWVNGEVSAMIKDRGSDFASPPVDPKAVGRLLALVSDGTVSANAAKEVLRAMAQGEREAAASIEKRGVGQISDAGAT